MLLIQCPMSGVGKLPPVGQIPSAACVCTAPEQWLLPFNSWKKNQKNNILHEIIWKLWKYMKTHENYMKSIPVSINKVLLECPSKWFIYTLSVTNIC